MYMFDGIWSTDFLYSLFIMGVVIWAILKLAFGVESFWNALILAFLAMIFLPFILSASQTMVAFLILVGLGALVIQWLYSGASFTAGVVVMLVVLLVGSMVLPAIS